MGRQGKREFVRVLRLLETFPADEVHAAVQDAIRGATGYRKPNTSKPAPEHRIYPYLLKGVKQSTGSIRFGQPTSPTCPCPGDSFISWPLWTGTAGTCWPGGSPILFGGPGRNWASASAVSRP